MNNELMKLMSVYFDPSQQNLDKNRGGSDLLYMEKLIAELLVLFKKYNIVSMFDAGCNDCRIGTAISPPMIYSGGDISAAMVADSWKHRSHFDIKLHDVTSDPLPVVDVLFVKDVTIHLNNNDKRKIINNWLDSNIPWIMLTHDEFETNNNDFEYSTGFPLTRVNWQLSPWNFPLPTECVYEVIDKGRCMALWHRDHLVGLM
jgi:hypothetical protein